MLTRSLASRLLIVALPLALAVGCTVETADDTDALMATGEEALMVAKEARDTAGRAMIDIRDLKTAVAEANRNAQAAAEAAEGAAMAAEEAAEAARMAADKADRIFQKQMRK